MKNTTRCWLLVLPLVLSGCGLAQRAEYASAHEQLTAAKAACKAAHSNSLADESDCQSAAEHAIEPPFVQNGDLLTLMQPQRKLLALRVDRGDMSRGGADVQLAQAIAEIRNEELARANASCAVAAQQSAASA